MYSKKIDPATKAILDQVPDLDYFARKLKSIDPLSGGNPIADVGLRQAYEAAAKNEKDLEDFMSNAHNLNAFRQGFHEALDALKVEMIAKGGTVEYLSDILHAIHYGDYIVQNNGPASTPQTPSSP